MDIERAKATIRQLLNLANDDSAAEGEIANAMRFAARLMEEHQLRDEDLSEVDDVLLNLERAEFAREGQFATGSKASHWESLAALFVCDLVAGIRCYWEQPKLVRSDAGIIQLDDRGRQQRKPRCVFYGVAEDVEIARQVFAELIVTIAAMARLKWGGVYRGDGRQYCEGFVIGLQGQLRRDSEQQRAIAQRSGGTALVAVQSRQAIAERKKELAKGWLRNECGVKLRTTSSGGGYAGSAAARNDGLADGSRHSVSAERRRKLSAS